MTFLFCSDSTAVGLHYHYLGLQFSEHYMSFDCVYKREIGIYRQFITKHLLSQKVDLGLYFHYEI